jgi:hypothetical protein
MIFEALVVTCGFVYAGCLLFGLILEVKNNGWDVFWRQEFHGAAGSAEDVESE